MSENTEQNEQAQALSDKDILEKYETLIRNIDQYGVFISLISEKYLPAPKEKMRDLIERSHYNEKFKQYFLSRLETFCDYIPLDGTLRHVGGRCLQDTLVFIVWWLYSGETVLWALIIPVFFMIITVTSVFNTNPLTIVSGEHRWARLALLYTIQSVFNLTLSISYFFISLSLLFYIGFYHLYVFVFVNFSLIGTAISLWALYLSRAFAINMGVYFSLTSLAHEIILSESGNDDK